MTIADILQGEVTHAVGTRVSPGGIELLEIVHEYESIPPRALISTEYFVFSSA